MLTTALLLEMICLWWDGIVVLPHPTNDLFSAIRMLAIALMWPESISLQPLITISDQSFTQSVQNIMSTTSAISLFHYSKSWRSNSPTSNTQLHIHVRPLSKLLVISINFLSTTLQTGNNDNFGQQNLNFSSYELQ